MGRGVFARNVHGLAIAGVVRQVRIGGKMYWQVCKRSSETHEILVNGRIGVISLVLWADELIGPF